MFFSKTRTNQPNIKLEKILMGKNGKKIILETLEGKVSERIPFALFCCGWEYRYKVAGIKVMLWNEGDVREILDDEAALGMDSFGVEQPRKHVNITMGDLRYAYGDDRCIMGNLDSEMLLMRGDKDEITSELHRIIEEAGKGLPFMMFNGSPIPSNVDIEVVQHIFDVMYNL